MRKGAFPTVCTAALLILPVTLVAVAPPAAAGLTIDAPGWTVVWPGIENSSAATLFTPGDATGDGVDDLLLLYPPQLDFNRPTMPLGSSFDLYPGSVNGLSPMSLSNSNGSIGGFFADQRTVSSPKGWDFDGDGLADVGFGHDQFSAIPEEQGIQFDIYLGSSAGFPTDWSCAKGIPGTLGDGFFGAALRPLGDLNGDGFDDAVAIRTPGYTSGGSRGSSHWLIVMPGNSTCANEVWSEGFPIHTENNGTISPIGSADFDRDGYDDLVTDETINSPSGAVSHRLRVYPGGPGNLSAPGASIPLQITGDSQFFVGSDLDADGYPDLAVGAVGSTLLGGEHFDFLFYRGSPSGLITTSPVGSQLRGQGFSGARASLGDINGDGFPDLALENSNISGETDRIRVTLFLGQHGAFGGQPDWSSTIRVSGITAPVFFDLSSTIEAAGDLDGDGLADLAVLAGADPYGMGRISDGQNASGEARSAILIFYGRQIVQYLSGVGPLGFDRGIAYPTYEYGFDVSVKAASQSVFDRIGVATPAGDLVFRPNTSSFSFQPNATLGVGEFVRLHSSSSAAFDGSTSEWDIRFRFEFTWDFPLGETLPYRLVATGPTIPSPPGAAPAGTFRVEKDLEFAGALGVTNSPSGPPVEAGDWVAGGAGLRATGLTVHFEGAPSFPVPADAFVWLGADTGGGSWSQGPDAADLDLAFSAAAVSNADDNIAITLSGVPNDDVRVPTTSFRYRVDADAPLFGASLPVNDSWVATHEVTVAAQILDPLSGTDPARVDYQISTEGPTAFGLWTPAALDGSNRTQATAVARATFLDGEANFFRFRVSDAVGNGPSVSETFQARVDTLHVIFESPAPPADSWQTSTQVTAAVTILDRGASGVAPASVAYRVSAAGLFEYRPWVPLPGLSPAVELRPQALVDLGEGDLNFVQWRAEDVVGTGLTVSAHYRVRVDVTGPVFGDPSPDPSVRLTAPELLVSIDVADGGPPDRARSGLDAPSTEYAFQPSGGDWGEWSIEGLTVYPGDDGNWSAVLALVLAPGPDNRVRFRGADLAGNGPTESPAVVYHLNRAPKVSLFSNVTNHTVVFGSNITLSANVSDPDGDRFNLTWYDGEGSPITNESEALDLGLAEGNWTFRVVARDTLGAEAEATITVQVLPVPPPPELPPPHPKPTQVADDSWWLILLLIVGGAAAMFVGRRMRGPPDRRF